MRLKYQVSILFLICFLNFFTNNQYFLPDIMEARNLITAREMADKGNWFNPTMNDYPRLAKPPLPTWINGLIAEYHPVDKLAIHRIPNAMVGTLMVLAIFFIGRNISEDSLFPFLSASIAASSYYLILMSKQATWDIYCHALMAAAICCFVIAWTNKLHHYRWHILAGILMGLSFLSKGPIAFYALLLPFLVSWRFFMEKSLFKEYWKPILASFGICFLISIAWPLHLYNINPEGLLSTISSETDAWSNRHVRPFYQYWGFWSHMGIWTTFSLIALFYPYAKKKIKNNYEFLLCWTVLIVVLLSIPAEKKERYLLPVIVPLSFLAGAYCTYLFRAWRKNELKNVDKSVVYFTSGVLAMACAIIPLYLYYNADNSIFMAISVLAFVVILILFIHAIYRFDLKQIYLGIMFFMTSLCLLVIPQLDNIYLYKNPLYESLAQLKKDPLYQLNFFSPFMNPKHILEIGKSVDTLRAFNNNFITPAQKKFVVLSDSIINESSFSPRIKSLTLRDTLYYDPESTKGKFYLYLGER